MLERVCCAKYHSFRMRSISTGQMAHPGLMHGWFFYHTYQVFVWHEPACVVRLFVHNQLQLSGVCCDTGVVELVHVATAGTLQVPTRVCSRSSVQTKLTTCTSHTHIHGTIRPIVNTTNVVMSSMFLYHPSTCSVTWIMSCQAQLFGVAIVRQQLIAGAYVHGNIQREAFDTHEWN